MKVIALKEAKRKRVKRREKKKTHSWQILGTKETAMRES